MRSAVFIACAVLVVSIASQMGSLTAANAQEDKFDGEWFAKGNIACAPKGGDEFEAVVVILNSQLSGKFRGAVRDYELSGTVGSSGKMNSGHLYSVLLGYNPVLKAAGNFDPAKATLSYSGAGAAGAYCGGDMTLTRLSSKGFEEASSDSNSNAATNAAQAELFQRLQIVKDAEEAGLINSEEAATRRAEILREF